jgi:hypothetical protein
MRDEVMMMDRKNFFTKRNVIFGAAALAVVLGRLATLVIWRNQPRGIVEAVSQPARFAQPGSRAERVGHERGGSSCSTGSLNFEVDAESGPLYRSSRSPRA